MLDYGSMLFVGGLVWLLGSVYFSYHRDRYPDAIILLFGTPATIGFLASPRYFNEGIPIEISFTLLDVALVIFFVSPFVLAWIVIKSFPSDDPDDGDLP